MSLLKGKKVVVGVCGGIAAYKACYLVRELIRNGAEVKVIMTPSACEFVTPLTFSTLSQNEVIVNIFPPDKKSNLKLSTWHIDLGMWADLMIAAPATVNTIAKINYGIADNALTTLVMALRCPLLLAPAADVDMYEDETNQKNIAELKSKGVFFTAPDFGELASGLVGRGRLAEVDEIIKDAEKILNNSTKDFCNKKVLITCGPTYEEIDPVRFIGNRSSGKMGFNLALAAYYRGADVTLVSGPTKIIFPDFIKVIKTESAEEMFSSVKKCFPKTDIFISAAAVSDYKPAKASNTKIKKSDSSITLELVKTKDILLESSKIKKKNQFIVGFALETDNELINAKEKLKKKNLDMIVLNSASKKGSGFETDTNIISILKKNGEVHHYEMMHKFEAANKILDSIF